MQAFVFFKSSLVCNQQAGDLRLPGAGALLCPSPTPMSSLKEDVEKGVIPSHPCLSAQSWEQMLYLRPSPDIQGSPAHTGTVP